MLLLPNPGLRSTILTEPSTFLGVGSRGLKINVLKGVYIFMDQRRGGGGVIPSVRY